MLDSICMLDSMCMCMLDSICFLFIHSHTTDLGIDNDRVHH